MPTLPNKPNDSMLDESFADDTPPAPGSLKYQLQQN